MEVDDPKYIMSDACTDVIAFMLNNWSLSLYRQTHLR